MSKIGQIQVRKGNCLLNRKELQFKMAERLRGKSREKFVTRSFRKKQKNQIKSEGKKEKPKRSVFFGLL